MEKVAILTHSVANNYGANLQALSTASYLRNHGYDPIFLQWSAYLEKNTLNEQEKIHKSFLRNHGFKLSEPLQTNNDFAKYMMSENIKRIVVGSDCVLTYESSKLPFILTRKGFIRRPKQSDDYSFPNPFWLPFIKNENDIKRCLMSASCGGGTSMRINDKIVKSSMIELLNQFDYISVRDSFTQYFLKKLLGDNKIINITPDPVFGFNKNVQYIPSEEDIRNKFNIHGKYYIISFYKQYWPNQDWADSLMHYAHTNGIKCISVLMPQGGRKSDFDINIDLPLDPLDWYALIKYSSGYIGNNMHPIIVAIHNNVPFFSFNIHGRSILRGRIQLLRSSKEYDLLKQLGLQNNVIPQPFISYFSTKRIIKCLNAFDIDKCKIASDYLQKEYDKMMKDILSILQDI